MKNKYKNTKCEYEGIKFDSKKEMERYIFLKEQQQKGVIYALKTHVRYIILDKIISCELCPKKSQKVLQRDVTYTADFVYTITKTNEQVVEDVKSCKFLLTKEYSLKKKMFFSRYRKQIKEVYKPNEPIS